MLPCIERRQADFNVMLRRNADRYGMKLLVREQGVCSPIPVRDAEPIRSPIGLDFITVRHRHNFNFCQCGECRQMPILSHPPAANHSQGEAFCRKNHVISHAEPTSRSQERYDALCLSGFLRQDQNGSPVAASSMACLVRRRENRGSIRRRLPDFFMIIGLAIDVPQVVPFPR